VVAGGRVYIGSGGGVSLVAAHWIYKRAGQSQVLQRRYNQLAQAMAEYRRALEKSQQDLGNGTSNKAHLIVRFRD
jgi:(p)ppGpp synthase/HD superfamily hydrolase